LQRKCACGGTAGPTGECEKCRKERQSLKRAALLPEFRTLDGARSAVIDSRLGHDSGRVNVYPAAPYKSTDGNGLSGLVAADSVGVDRQNGVAHGPAGGANRWTDCPATWRPKANVAQTLGANWVDNVVNGLGNLPKPIPPSVSALLTRHFHTTFDKDITKILSRYKQIQTAIHSSLDFECETNCDTNVLAYVYSIWTNLHLCPYWFNSNADLQAATVIHEIAHDVVGADDNAYEWETAKYTAMSVSDAMNNADSFGHFAWDASKPPPTPPPPPAAPPPGPTPTGP
jgi:hypothetical protein